MRRPDLSLFYTGCTLEHILQNNTIKRFFWCVFFFFAIFWRLTFSGHILTRLFIDSRCIKVNEFQHSGYLTYEYIYIYFIISYLLPLYTS
jgi:hypothetical protein